MEGMRKMKRKMKRKRTRKRSEVRAVRCQCFNRLLSRETGLGSTKDTKSTKGQMVAAVASLTHQVSQKNSVTVLFVDTH
jgi:hypothetical protein